MGRYLSDTETVSVFLPQDDSAFWIGCDAILQPRGSQWKGPQSMQARNSFPGS